MSRPGRGRRFSPAPIERQSHDQPLECCLEFCAISFPGAGRRSDGRADVLQGGSGNDLLAGGRGDDVLFGDSGQDWLLGQLGDDTLVDGDGLDWFVGGPGEDVLQQA